MYLVYNSLIVKDGTLKSTDGKTEQICRQDPTNYVGSRGNWSETRISSTCSTYSLSIVGFDIYGRTDFDGSSDSRISWNLEY